MKKKSEEETLKRTYNKEENKEDEFYCFFTSYSEAYVVFNNFVSEAICMQTHRMYMRN